jgi:hypothetical protein
LEDKITILLIVGIVFCALSCLIAIANIVVGIAGTVRKRRGLPTRHPSMVYVLSIVFSIVAYICAGSTLGLWVFMPATIDPATFFLFAAPVLLLKTRRQSGNGQEGS